MNWILSAMKGLLISASLSLRVFTDRTNH